MVKAGQLRVIQIDLGLGSGVGHGYVRGGEIGLLLLGLQGFRGMTADAVFAQNRAVQQGKAVRAGGKLQAIELGEGFGTCRTISVAALGAPFSAAAQFSIKSLMASAQTWLLAAQQLCPAGVAVILATRADLLGVVKSTTASVAS